MKSPKANMSFWWELILAWLGGIARFEFSLWITRKTQKRIEETQKRIEEKIDKVICYLEPKG